MKKLFTDQGHDAPLRCANLLRGLGRVRRRQRGLPVPKIVGARVRRRGPPVARRQVFEKFYAGSAVGAESGNMQLRAGHVVQVLLLGAAVRALTRDSEAQ